MPGVHTKELIKIDVDEVERNGIPITRVPYESYLVKLEDITAYIQPRAIQEFVVKLLVSRMRQHGFLEQYPISVSVIQGQTPTEQTDESDPTDDEEPRQEYRIFCGSHRLQAAKLLGMKEVPALVYTDISIDEQWQRANISNQAHDAIARPTFIDHAQQVWRHLSEGLTQVQAASRMPGWSRESIKNYAALEQIYKKAPDAWQVIGTTFSETSTSDDENSVPGLVQPVPTPFTEGLLRPYVSLTGTQLLKHIGQLAKDWRDSEKRKKAKERFKDSCELDLGHNAMTAEAEQVLGIEGIPSAYLERAIGEIHKSIYDKEYAEKKEIGPKFRQMLAMLLDEFSQTQNYHVHHWDINDLENGTITQEQMPDESINFLITDPPYGTQYIPLYNTLGAVAARLLKPGGSLLVMPGSNDVLEKMNLVAQHLKLYHIICYDLPGGQATQLWNKEMLVFWKPVFWFVKEPFEGFKWQSDQSKQTTGDKVRSAPNDNNKRIHRWGQSVSGMYDLIERYTQMGDVIFDPFCGASPIGVAAIMNQRKFIGSDNHLKCIKVSIAQLRAASLGQDPPADEAE